ncbi:MAG: tRNA (N6-isopentenyl adenosine(37)-C2)-methylthiotransferase MiaB [Desulfovibrio sp.]|nr:tRNA (N6-isopentenyl adenosine(37)-C2)-methylthiotransferase MiaB [Desulfovibrio sp.]
MATFQIITFGCQMNVNDSDWLGQVLLAHGHQKAALSEAQCIFLNTCSVREKPEQKVRSSIQQLLSERKNNPPDFVAVLGCVAQQLGEDFFALSPHLRLVAGPDALPRIPTLVDELLAEPRLKISLLDFTHSYEEREEGLALPVGPAAYVNIMQGCDNFCTYCIVPFTRGRQKSRAFSAIVAECRRKIALGASEITLLGQNVNAYGCDKHAQAARAKGEVFPSFAELLREIAQLPGLKRLRYTSPHPKDMREEDLMAFGSLSTLCPQLHLPLQSGSSRVLARMGRGYNRQEYSELVSRLRQIRPDLALTTDLIVGFPGETEEDLAETLSLMEECQFLSSFSFCYSDRPGTRATNFFDKIPKELQHARLLRVQTLQDELQKHLLKQRVGTSTLVLLESQSRRWTRPGYAWQGRDPYGTLVHVAFDQEAPRTGELVLAQITEAGSHCLFARRETANDRNDV